MIKMELKNILDIYEKEISKNMKNKNKIYRFERYKMMNINAIYKALINPNYYGGYYNIFMIKYPKYRIVMALNIKDKVINHYVARYYLMPSLEKRLDNRNIATREGLGRDYGIKLVKKYIEQLKPKGEFYILKIDIKKYFYSINHDILKKMLKKDLKDDQKYNYICKIIDSTNHDYINKKIQQLKEWELNIVKARHSEIEDIPLYEKGKGLPIGNMTSQFLSIYYLNELDHKIVHDYKIKHYVRYMDDFILFSDDKEYLKELKNKIETELNTAYCLEINKKKTNITSSKEGFNFCGYRFRVINKKTIMTVSTGTKRRVKKRIKEVKYLFDKDEITLRQAFSSINTYYFGFKYGSKLKMQRLVERYFFTKG